MKTVDEIVAESIGKDLTLCRDYASIVNWSVTKIESWTAEWTDYSITDPGILFINAEAYQYDFINYVLDKSFLNNILRFTRSEEVLYFMSKFVGLDLPTYESAEGTLLIRNYSSLPLNLSKFFSVYNRDKATGTEVWFSLSEDVEIPPNSSAQVAVIEGQPGRVDVSLSDFNAFYELFLPIENISLNSVSVLVNVSYVKNRTLYDANLKRRSLMCDDILVDFYELASVKDAILNTDKVPCFSAHSSYKSTYVKLFPGVSKDLFEGCPIVIFYGQCLGVGGNIGQVDVKPSQRITSGVTDITDSCEFTLLGSSRGTSPSDTEGKRVYIGDNTWRVDTLVTEADFASFAQNYYPEEIIRFVYLQNQGEEKGLVYFVPKEDISVARRKDLVIEVKELLQPFAYGNIDLVVKEIGYTDVIFQLDIILSVNTSDLSRVRQQIREILESYFDRETQEKGMLMRRSQILGLLEQIYEIEYVACNYPTSDLAVGPTEIFVFRDVEMNFLQKGEKYGSTS